MNVRHSPPSFFVTALLAFFLTGTGAAVAEQYCSPHCDYIHYYGPFDFSYIRPGLIGYPQCGLQGDCAPHLAFVSGVRRGRVTVRFPRVTVAPPQQ
jgi:hypothetical protein